MPNCLDAPISLLVNVALVVGANALVAALAVPGGIRHTSAFGSTGG